MVVSGAGRARRHKEGDGHAAIRKLAEFRKHLQVSCQNDPGFRIDRQMEWHGACTALAIKSQSVEVQMSNSRRPIPVRSGIVTQATFLALILAGCGTGPRSAMDALPDHASATTRQYAQVKDMMDTLEPRVEIKRDALMPAPLIGRGFAQVARQPGESLNQRRLLAMRAARLEALRDLTEQVHGVRLTSDSLLRDAILRDDRLAARVEGSLRGARTVAIEPRGEDGYAVTMQIDADTVAYVLRAVGTGR